jgi:hypothetical protein
MKTSNPRLTVTLKPSTFAQLREVSRLTGSSQSSLIGDILEQAEPVFQRLIKLLSAAEQAKQEIKLKTASELESAQERLEKQMGLMLGDFDAASGSLIREAETIRRRAGRVSSVAPLGGAGGARRALRGQVTPPSNRGVRSTANPVKKAKASS